MSLTEEKITLKQMPQLLVELKGEILGIKEMIAALGGSSGNRRWEWGQIGCESEAAFRPQLTIFLPSRLDAAVARSECSTTKGLH